MPCEGTHVGATRVAFLSVAVDGVPARQESVWQVPLAHETASVLEQAVPFKTSSVEFWLSTHPSPSISIDLRRILIQVPRDTQGDLKRYKIRSSIAICPPGGLIEHFYNPAERKMDRSSAFIWLIVFGMAVENKFHMACSGAASFRGNVGKVMIRVWVV